MLSEKFIKEWQNLDFFLNVFSIKHQISFSKLKQILVAKSLTKFAKKYNIVNILPEVIHWSWGSVPMKIALDCT